MWPYTPKPKPKAVPSDEKPKYEVGDKVRIWTVFKRPSGRVLDVKEVKGVTIFTVSYDYHDGRYYSEDFEGGDLTLVEKQSKKNCNCGSNSQKHSSWCNKIVHPQGW